MRNLSRRTAVLACAVALLLALPAHAAPPQRSHAVAQASPTQAVAAWLGALFTDLTRLFAPAASQPADSGSKTPDMSPPGRGRPLLDATQGGSCIDPDGCVPN